MPATTTLGTRAMRRAGLGSFFRPKDVGTFGIDESSLRRLVKRGIVETVARGLYRLAASEGSEHYTLAGVCARVPSGIVCLLTALQYHGIGTRMPPEVWLAIPHGQRAAKVALARVRFVRFSGIFLTAGVDEIRFDGVPARITNPARTVIDSLRLTRLIDRETALEAVRESLRSRLVTSSSLLRMARACGTFERTRAVLEILGA